MLMFSVRDSKAAAFLPPFFAPTVGVATRMFASAARDASHDFHRYAEDYTLFQVGEFDEQTGKVSGLPSPEPVVLAANLLSAEEGR